jgi:hypothetical protein
MARRYRLAEAADVPRMGEIRSAVPLRQHAVARGEEEGSAVTAGTSVRGGYLLGSSAEVYGHYVEQGCVMVAEARGVVVAYSVVLPDSLLRLSDVYAKRHAAGLPAALLQRLERSQVAYFDQLAALPGSGVVAAGLAYHHLVDAFWDHDAVLATTVLEPVENRAAVPLLHAIGFVPVGEIDEEYPVVGRLRSRVYAAERAAVAAVRATPLAQRYERRIALAPARAAKRAAMRAAMRAAKEAAKEAVPEEELPPPSTREPVVPSST